MKIRSYVIIIAIIYFLLPQCGQAQISKSNNDVNFTLENLLNERNATNLMYEILYSFEEITISWNQCMSNDSICKKSVLDTLINVEKKFNQYIFFIQQPLLPISDTKTKVVSLSMTNGRLPSYEEATLINYLLKKIIDMVKKDEKCNRWIQEINHLREEIIISVNN